MTDDELILKFTDCLAAGGIDPGVALQISDQVLDLEKQPSTTGLLQHLVVRA